MLKEQLQKELDSILIQAKKVEVWLDENKNHKRNEEGYEALKELFNKAAAIYSEILEIKENIQLDLFPPSSGIL